MAREVEIVHGRSHGWIDLLAFDRRTGTMLILEIKTRLSDLGAIERQIAWYERMGMATWHESLVGGRAGCVGGARTRQRGSRQGGPSPPRPSNDCVSDAGARSQPRAG
jgi:hypothetical protein